MGYMFQAGDIALVLLLGIGGLVALVYIVERARTAAFAKSGNRMNTQRGLILDRNLEKRKGERLTAGQRQLLTGTIGLYNWIPKELHPPWEERILTFIDSFIFSSMDGRPATEEMKLLVAAEACLLIIKRPMSDYRHLRRIQLWENEIEGAEHARGTATIDEVNFSWKHLMQTIADARDGHNLVLHEFAHVIDFADDGIAQSIPVSPHAPNYEEWKRTVDDEHQRLMSVYESGKNYAIRAYGGYESVQGDKPEIFSCATSAFFERGSRLRRESPQIYSMLKRFYGMDPAIWRKRTD